LPTKTGSAIEANKKIFDILNQVEKKAFRILPSGLIQIKVSNTKPFRKMMGWINRLQSCAVLKK
jgi:hypothetical protein